MTKGELQIMAGVLVVESKLTYPAKKQLFTFIKTEATESQLKAFLLDGKVVIVDEQASEVIDDRFIIAETGGRIAKLRKSAMSLAGYSGGAGAGWALYRGIRGALGICTKKCGTFEVNTSRRQHCMLKCKKDIIEKKLALARKKDPKAVAGLERQLASAKKTEAKSTRSFTNRGTEAPR